jgi:hypothetical protein
LLLLCLAFPPGGKAQQVVTGRTLIHSLLSDSSEVYDVFIPRYQSQPLVIEDIPFLRTKGHVPQKLIRTRKGLFALVDGTGRIYEIKKAGDSLLVHRIDSTIFFGYNFGAEYFAWRDTIYSFGGYGMWRYNGHLRVYIPKLHEWELVPLSREVPFYTNATSGFKTWFDSKAGRLYVNKMPEKLLEPDSIYALDLPERRWTFLGKNILPLDYLSGQINTPWGVLCNGKEDYTTFILLDFRRNLVFNLSEKKSREIIHKEKPNSRYFFRDSTLFIEHDSIYKIPLSIKDFNPTSLRIYEVQDDALISSMSNMVIQYWRTGTIMAISLLLGFLAANFQLKKRAQHEPGAMPYPSKLTIDVFDEKEKGLIQLIAENSLKNATTSIDDINKILGLSEKPQDLQKKHRSDTISSINQKYLYITRREGLLLKKNRSDMDKRSFEYYIDFDDYKALKSLL